MVELTIDQSEMQGDVRRGGQEFRGRLERRVA